MSMDPEYSVAVAELRIMVEERGFGDSKLEIDINILPALGLMDPDRQIRFLDAAKGNFADYCDGYIQWLKGTRPKPPLRVVG